MRRSLAVAVLVALALALALAAAGSGRAQEKKDWTPSVELTDKAGKWLLNEAAVGARLFTDRKEYYLTAVPKQMAGGTLVVRGSGEYGGWLPGSSLKAKKDATVFAVVRVMYGKEEKFGELAQSLLMKDGWKEVRGKVATSYPKNEEWQWKAFAIDVNKGEINLRLKNLDWENHATGIFFVVRSRGEGDKAAKAPKSEAVEKVLLGTWKVKVGPTFETEWTFQKGGMVLSSKGQPKGKWAIEEKNKRVLITWNQKDWDSLTLPLSEKQSSGKSSHSDRWVVAAVKLRGPDKDKAARAKVYKTPQEVFDAFVAALNNSDERAIAACLSPAALDALASQYVARAFNKRFAYDSEKGRDKDALKYFKPYLDVMDKHGLTEKALKGVNTRGEGKEFEKAVKVGLSLVKDKVAFIGDFEEAERKQKGQPPREAPVKVKLTDVKIEGKKATGTAVLMEEGKKEEKVPYKFLKVGEGWTIDLGSGKD
jgi:hypothetical protein